MKLNPTIGLEIHVELKTHTKMFCACLNNPDEKTPNKNVCPICLGHPGTLPTINKNAVLNVIKVGLALGGEIAEDSHFDRKSYFYPDLPKGYQISQYDKPFVIGGELNGIRIRRIHLEEDTGRLLHDGKKYTLVDFNRAGIPLMELVTEPDIKTAEEAVNFARELQLILRYLDVSCADMERGQMRVEVNISLQDPRWEFKEGLGLKSGTWLFHGNVEDSIETPLNVRAEIKNLNSFKAVDEAINYELRRQGEAIEKGNKITQETRGWNDSIKETVSQRFKEESHDYRYFSEPDLPPLNLKELNIENLAISLPELPEVKRKRFTKEFGLDKTQAEILVAEKNMADFFESAVSELKIYDSQAKSPSLLYNYLTSDLLGIMNQKQIYFEGLKTTPEHFAHLVVLISKGDLSSRMAKDILIKMVEIGLDPEEIVKETGYRLISGGNELEEIIKEVINENPNAVSDFKKGKQASIQFLIGKTIAKSKGQASPEKLKLIFEKLLN